MAQPTTPGNPGAGIPGAKGDKAESVEVTMADEMKQARALQDQGQWVEAAELYMLITEAQPDNGTAWFNLGYCLHAAGELDLAMSAHRKAATFDEYTGIALYNLGCAHSLLGELDEAFETLKASHEAGFNVGKNLHSDSDLVNLQDDPRFGKLVEMTREESAGEKFKSALLKARQYLRQNGPALMEQAKAMAQQAAGVAQQKLQEMKEIAGDEEKQGEIRQKLSEAFARAHEAFFQWREAQAADARTDALVAEADAYYQSQDWPAAAEAYRIVVEADPDNGLAWNRLGYSLHIDGQIEAALKAHLKAAQFDDFRGIALYNAACALSLLGRTDEACETLARCREAGFERLSGMASDTDFDNIRADPRFVAILESLDPDGE